MDDTVARGQRPGTTVHRVIQGTEGFCGSREKGYLFSGSWGALIIIFGDLGSKLIVLGISTFWSPDKSKK